MLENVDFEALTQYAKALANFTPAQETLLVESRDRIIKHLRSVTDGFYDNLLRVPSAAEFLEGRVDQLKNTHVKWLEKVFTGPYDASYTAYMYRVGDTHVRVNLPVEFMAGGMTLILEKLNELVAAEFRDDPLGGQSLQVAITAVLGFSLILMQKSYQTSVEDFLERFLKITGISRQLFNNMAKSYTG